MKRKKIQILFLMTALLSGLAGFYLSIKKGRSTRTFHYPQVFLQELKDDPHAGEKIVEAYCSACHGKNPVIEVGAPRMGDKAAWKSINAQDFSAVMELTKKGFGAMPARGGCFECSDEQLKQSVIYLMESSQ